MKAVGAACALAGKELRVEVRAREALATTCFFAGLVLLVFNFALGPGSAVLRDAAPGLLWVAFLFTGMLGVVAVFGTVGLAAVGTLVAAMTATLLAREVLLPLLLIPLVVPVILGAVRATEGVLLPGPITDATSWLKLLAVFDVMFLAACPLVFEFVLEG